MRFGIKPRYNGRRACITSLAVLALLSHVLVPAVLMAAARALNPGAGSFRLTLCNATPQGDASGKAKPGLPAHHCALCPLPAADLYRPPTGLMPTSEGARGVYRRLAAEWPAPSLRHGQMQARAPPATV